MFYSIREVFIHRPWQPLVLASILVALVVPMGKTDGSAVPQSSVAQAQAVAPAPKPAIPDPAQEAFQRPLSGYRITQYFGRYHTGIDLAAPYGTIVRASKTGVVEIRRTRWGYGNLIILHHIDGSLTYYAHLSRIEVVPGQSVHQGDEIGRVGSVGNSTGNHLHFEIRYKNIPQNPLKYVAL